MSIFGAPVGNAAVEAKLCADTPESTDDAPSGGWQRFLEELALEYDGMQHLPVAETKESEVIFKHRRWPDNGYAIRLRHTPTGCGYQFSKFLGSGGFGVVVLMQKMEHPAGPPGMPGALALKLFQDQSKTNEDFMTEIKNVMHMAKADWTSTSPLPDRVPAHVLFDRANGACVVMPVMSGNLHFRFGYTPDDAFCIVKAVFREVNSMWETYGLLCCDLKGANVLVDCKAGAPGTPPVARVRAADYGGYLTVGIYAAPTFPLPWHTLRRLRQARLTEEVCVYNFVTLFLELTACDTNPFVWNEMIDIRKAELLTPGTPDFTLRNYARIVRKNKGKWGPPIKHFLNYASRYRVGGDGKAFWDMSLPPRTMSGLKEVLMPHEEPGPPRPHHSHAAAGASE